MMLVPPRSPSRRAFARPLLALALGASLAFASACGSDSPTGPKDVPGTYLLRTVDDSTLPFSVPEGREHVIVVNSVTATLNANNTYAVAGTGTEDGNASTVITDAGHVHAVGIDASLHIDDARRRDLHREREDGQLHGDAPRWLSGFRSRDVCAAVRKGELSAATGERSRLALLPDDCCS